MATIHRNPVDASTELIVDSIVLTSDVLHSIRNNLPIPEEKRNTHKIRRVVPTAPRWFALTAGLVLCAASLVGGGMALSAPSVPPLVDMESAKSVVSHSITAAAAFEPELLIRAQLREGQYKSAAALMAAQPEQDEETQRAIVYTLALAGEVEGAYAQFAKLSVESPQLLAHVKSHDPEYRSVVIDETFLELRAYDSKAKNFTTTMDGQSWLFVPGDAATESVETYRQCRVANCADAKAAYFATVERETFNHLFDRVGTPRQDSARSWKRKLPFTNGSLSGVLIKR